MNGKYIVFLVAQWLVSVIAWVVLQDDNYMIVSNIYMAGLLVVLASKS